MALPRLDAGTLTAAGYVTRRFGIRFAAVGLPRAITGTKMGSRLRAFIRSTMRYRATWRSLLRSYLRAATAMICSAVCTIPLVNVAVLLRGFFVRS